MLDDSIKENIATAEVYTRHTHTPTNNTHIFRHHKNIKNIKENNELGLVLLNVVFS